MTSKCLSVFLKLFCSLMLIVNSTSIIAEANITDFDSKKLVFITYDGLRWQEVFKGIDPDITKEITNNDHPFADESKQFSQSDEKKNRRALFPFFWGEVKKYGSLIGNKNKNSNVKVKNGWCSSYPGYNELLTGLDNDNILGNENIENPNITLFEWLNKSREFKNKFIAWTNWKHFSSILNVRRSKLLLNKKRLFFSTKTKQTHLVDMQPYIESLTNDERDDFIFYQAIDDLKKQTVKIMYLALGATDVHAHEDDYYSYLSSSKRNNYHIQQLWQTIQSLPFYKGKTNLIITTDHGRGTKNAWGIHTCWRYNFGWLYHKIRYLGKADGAENIWVAAIGPDIKNNGEMKNHPTYFQNQIAATLASLLKKNFKQFRPDAGEIIRDILVQP